MIDHKTALERARELVAQMTIEEQATQLRYNAPAIPRLGIPAYNWWNEALHGVARAGTATVFPQAIGLAAMFDTDAQKEIGEIIATEGRAKYNMQSALGDRDIYKGLTFWSPNVNIFRDPRWGRGHETYGEDPYLTSRLGVAFVKGVQGNGKYLKAAACAKHYAVHSGPEAIRHGFNAEVSKKDLRETYLPAFEALVKEADVEAVMGAYNAVNGEPCCGSPTLESILRDEWKFEGHFVSDCWAIADIHNYHHYTSTAPESAALAIRNGCDLNCGNTYLNLLIALQEGRIEPEWITRSCIRMMATRIRLGLFDEDCEYDAIPYTECDTKENAAAALRMARSSMVLLKNDGLLPLRKDSIRTIAVIGPNADSRECLVGNYNGTSSRLTTLLEGIRAAAGEDVRVLYSQGCHLYKDRVQGLAQPDDLLAEAEAVAKLADVVVLCVGLDGTLEGEQGDVGNEYGSGDKPGIELPETQQKLIARVMKTGTPTVTVLAAGSAIRVEDGNAIICAWYPGQAGGTALADVLFGKVSPSGKLPLTFYKDSSDIPDFNDYSMTGRTYRYFTGTPLYPFGFGLSYASFAYSDAAYDNGAVSVTVKNTGDCAADEIVQVYIRPEGSKWAVPNHSLCGFARVKLAPGEQKQVSIAIPEKAFCVVNDEGEFVRDASRFTLFVGGSQPDARSVELTGANPLTLTIEL
ncbi:MAG: glycoside hydrolase family 3 C-terminal domain-containing protein [Clostridia bacterium]|nr:glycoside hydrolase family 3 C-terminal domain-containing protein [Clostridia bacterium]